MHQVKYYLPGSIVIAIAILIVYIPEILIAFVASAIIMIGILALYVGHLIRNSDRRLRSFDRWLWVDNSYGKEFFNTPRMKWWFRKF
jgi:hypothetical protein